MIGNIMIVDDSPVERKLITHILGKRLNDICLFEAENGMDIVDKLLDNNIHVCILDIRMPIKNGFEVLKEIKENSALVDLPVIVCTGIEDKDAIENALLLGAYDYFSKPLSEEAMKISLPLKVKNAIEFMKRKEEIIYLSYHDKLTNLFNRRYVQEELEKLDNHKNLPISLVSGDVNGLKLTNDAFGHEAGDKILIKIANIMREECKNGEIPIRMGGDEFLIIMPKAGISEARALTNRIKERCLMEKEEPIKPSISFGCYTKEYPYQKIMDVFKAAEDRMYNDKFVDGKSIRSSIISSLIKTLYERSHETEAHCNRLMALAQKMGKIMDLSSYRIENLKLLALLHDIGITAIPDDILRKGNQLSEDEDNILKSHCEIGYRIASCLPDLAHITDDILSHHENWDGSGYPQGLKGEAIPLNARIISVLDTYDSMVNGRFNREIVPENEVLRFLREQSGKCFDPDIVNIFLEKMV